MVQKYTYSVSILVIFHKDEPIIENIFFHPFAMNDLN